MVSVRKNNDWSNYLRYSVYLPEESHELLLYDEWGIDSTCVKLKYEIEEWCEETFGYTNQSTWHKDRWHPKKPKWYFDCKVEYVHEGRRITCLVKFFEIEDAMAFKLRWT